MIEIFNFLSNLVPQNNKGSTFHIIIVVFCSQEERVWLLLLASLSHLLISI